MYFLYDHPWFFLRLFLLPKMLPRIQQNNFAWSNYENNIFNSDGQQFHQYQRSEQLPLTSTGIIEKKKTTTYCLGNPEPGLGQAQKSVGLKLLLNTPPLTMQCIDIIMHFSDIWNNLLILHRFYLNSHWLDSF
jgi:hypothetical protein